MEPINDKRFTSKKQVIQTDRQGNITRIFDTMPHAILETGINYNALKRAIQVSREVDGYFYRYPSAKDLRNMEQSLKHINHTQTLKKELAAKQTEELFDGFDVPADFIKAPNIKAQPKPDHSYSADDQVIDMDDPAFHQTNFEKLLKKAQTNLGMNGDFL